MLIQCTQKSVSLRYFCVIEEGLPLMICSDHFETTPSRSIWTGYIISLEGDDRKMACRCKSGDIPVSL